GMQALIRDLNALYREVPALHDGDCDPAGFRWVVMEDTENSVFAYLRQSIAGAPPALVICNLTPVPRHAYRLGVPHGGRWVERLNSDAALYGGSNTGNGGAVWADEHPIQGYPASLSLTLPPLATLVLLPA
ncbi:MAG: alpha amylase C-terminal domain-containing protein, partial [Acetobacteraceae bacterium]|nr:alpha amylase C-terminal domain-containing protein [Acetobacteraceae bacterium]